MFFLDVVHMAFEDECLQTGGMSVGWLGCLVSVCRCVNVLVHRLVDLPGKMDHFEATCPENLKGGTIDLASRAVKFLSYLAAWRYVGGSVCRFGC